MSVVSLMSVYIVLFTLLVYYSTGEVTMGSDMARYFNTNDQLNVLSSLERALAQSETSNTFFYLVNYLARITSPSELVAILSIRLSNIMIFGCAYLSAVKLAGQNEKNSPSLTIFDYAFLLMPFGIMVASRNLRDIYILYCLLELTRLLFSGKDTRYRALKIITFAILLHFLRKLLLPILMVLFLIIKVSENLKNTRRKIMMTITFIITLFAILEIMFSHIEAVRRTIWGVLFFFSDLEYQRIQSMSLFVTLFQLITRAVSGIPYLIMLPSPFNDLTFSFTRLQIVSSGYLSYEFMLVFLQSIINYGFVFPCLLFTIRKLFIKRTFLGDKRKLEYALLGIIVVLTAIYAATVKSPHFRTRFLIIEIMVTFSWVSFGNNINLVVNKFFLIMSACFLCSSILLVTI